MMTPSPEQMVEQPPQDHGVGHIGDLEFVKAQQPRLFGQRMGHNRNGIAGTGALAFGMNAGMHIHHEAVEMGAPFLR